MCVFTHRESVLTQPPWCLSIKSINRIVSRGAMFFRLRCWRTFWLFSRRHKNMTDNQTLVCLFMMEVELCVCVCVCLLLTCVRGWGHWRRVRSSSWMRSPARQRHCNLPFSSDTRSAEPPSLSGGPRCLLLPPGKERMRKPKKNKRKNKRGRDSKVGDREGSE